VLPALQGLSYRSAFLGGLLKRIGHFGMRTFADRLILQKLVYLLQAFGIYLGYRFSWYLRGPYSPRLAADGFELEPHYERVSKATFWDAALEGRFREFVRFISPFKRDPDMLELMASIHFLRKLHPQMRKSEIIAVKQPYFGATKAEAAWKELKEAGLL